MGSLGIGEIILILVIFLLLFGAKRLPEFARSLGKSLKEFKKATSDITSEIDEAVNSKQIDEKKSKTEVSKDSEK
ncbi:MAG: twin-arginine translocase TatA/TatE family subunit [Candidatus Marinimicrobia bacterium]|nr:twin-arginine translocase TatA/TatE family subunit [Candidatus Neomarinimicrobiota bacterium]MBL7066925.1 twin-arginine translocase TatA/TatE family subunit [Candidatus Neomarinimicrobiota bacterium]